MKKQLLLCLVILAAITTQAQQKIKDGTGTPVSTLPAAGSLLELESAQAGLRMPQVSLTDTKTWAPLLGSGAATTSPGMTVYNTNVGITNVTSDVNYPALGKGEYYWDGTGWVCKNSVVSKVEYLQATAGTFTTVPAGATPIITFGGYAPATSYYSPSGSITWNGINTITLQPGKTYECIFDGGYINCLSAPPFDYSLSFGWFDNNTNTYIGHQSWEQHFASGTFTDHSSTIATLFITPTVVTNLSVRVRCFSSTLIQMGVAGDAVNASILVKTLN